MPRYAYIVDGRVANILTMPYGGEVEFPKVLSDVAQIGWSYDQATGAFSDLPARVVTQGEFSSRLGISVLANISEIAKTDSIMAGWLIMHYSHPTIRLDGADTRMGLAYLKAIGCVTDEDIARVIA